MLFDLNEDIEELGYAGTLFMDLNVDKLMKLGWHPCVDLKDAYMRMINSTLSGSI